MTIKQQQQKNRAIRNALAEIATKSGAIDRVNRILSANYLLHSQSSVLLGDSEEILSACGLRGGKLISRGKTLNNAFNEYFKEFAKLVPKEQVQNWADDLTTFDKMFRKFAKLEDEFKPREVDVSEIEKKFNVKIEKR